MKAKDVALRNSPPSIILYGTAGTGKTALVSQAKNGFLFDFDDGLRTTYTLKDQFTELRKNVDCETYVDRSVKKTTAYINFKNKLLEFQNSNVKYDALIVDSLTGLCRAIRSHVMCCAGNSLGVPQIQHYGQMVNELEGVLTVLRSLDKLILVTAHENIVEVDGNSMIRIMSITEKHGTNKLSWLFDEVLYCKSKIKGQGKIDYIVTGRSSSSITTRTRSSIHEDIVVNEIGLDGLLEKMGYKQGLRKEVNGK